MGVLERRAVPLSALPWPSYNLVTCETTPADSLGPGTQTPGKGSQLLSLLTVVLSVSGDPMKATDFLSRKTYTSIHASNFAGDFQERADMCVMPYSDPPRSEGHTPVCRHSCITCGVKCKRKT